MKAKLNHVSNPMQQTEIEIAEFDGGIGSTCTVAGYTRASDIYGDGHLRWVNVGESVHPAHHHPLLRLTPADLAKLGK